MWKTCSACLKVLEQSGMVIPFRAWSWECHSFNQRYRESLKRILWARLRHRASQYILLESMPEPHTAQWAWVLNLRSDLRGRPML